MKVFPHKMSGERVTGVTVVMERQYPFSLPHVMNTHETIDFPQEKKRGQNLTYRIMFCGENFELSRDAYPDGPAWLDKGTCEMQIAFGSGALKAGQEFTDRMVGLKLEKILTKLLKFCKEHEADLAAYMTFGLPLMASPKDMLSLIAKKPNTDWHGNLRRDHRHHKELVQEMMKELRKDIAKAQRMQTAKTKEKETS